MSGGPVTVRRLEGGQARAAARYRFDRTRLDAQPAPEVDRPPEGQVGPETSASDALSWPTVPGGNVKRARLNYPCPISSVASATPCRPGWGARTTPMSLALLVRYN